MIAVMNAIRSIRNIRAEMEVPPSRRAKVILVVNDDWMDIFEKSTAYFEKLAWASEVVLKRDREGIPANAVSAVTDKAQIFMPLEDLVDFEKEMERLLKEKANLEKELARVEGKLSNRNFVEKAPPAVVEEERKKKEKYQDMMAKVLSRIEALNSMRK